MTIHPGLTIRFYAAAVVLLSITASVQAEKLDVWIGTGSSPSSEGIYHCMLDTEKGSLSEPELAAKIKGPGFLAMHPSRSHLYAVGTLDGKPCVAAYAIDRTGPRSTLSFVNSVETGDGGAAHIAVDPTGQTILTAQYGGGSVAVFSLNQDGSLAERTQLVEHSGGAGVVDRRQDSPHPHWCGFSPDNKFAFVPDLGLDQIVIYRLDPKASKLTTQGSGHVPPGGGPRHMKFHPNGKWIYVLNELDLSVTLFDFDAESGGMSARQTLPTVPKEQLLREKFKSCSEIRVHPNGHFVFAANRGHDTITVFRVNQQTGELSVVEREFVRGATPRNFNLSPDGKWLIAAGQDSDTLALFQVAPDSGELTYWQSNVTAPNPICVLFQPE